MVKPLSEFEIEAGVETDKVQALKIMAALRKNLCSKWTLLAKGTASIQQCDRVAAILSPWIVVKNVEVNKCEESGQKQMKITFGRSFSFMQKFYGKKERVVLSKQNK